MHFRIEQRLPGPLEAVEEALLDPGFLERLAALPKLGHPQLLDRRVDGDLVHQRVRYVFAGELSSAVTGLLWTLVSPLAAFAFAAISMAAAATAIAVGVPDIDERSTA